MKASDRTGTLPASLRGDCARCAGLCCVVPAFYSLQGFGFDKPAHSACRHLTRANRCAIHDARAASGFASCVGFDCHGAGQRVTQDLFGGADWRTSSELATRMFAAYESCVALHRLMALLALAESVIDEGPGAGAGIAPDRAASPPSPLSEPLRATRHQLRAKREQLDELCRSMSLGTATGTTPGSGSGTGNGTASGITRLEIKALQRETYALIRLAYPTPVASAPARTPRPADRPE